MLTSSILVLLPALSPVGLQEGASSSESMARAAIETVLDDLHDAQSRLDAARFFGHFDARAVIHGTDPEERWTLEEYRAFTQPAFASGVARRLRTRERNIELAPSGTTAWFDEREWRPNQPQLRCSGVLERSEAGWKVVQLQLALPVPNELVRDLSQRLARAGRAMRAEPQPAAPEPPSAQVVKAVLANFHSAAAEADGQRYFAQLAPRALFYGTAPEERWNVAELRARCEPSFARGQGWSAKPLVQHVTLSADGRSAWFDESLENAAYATTRSTGLCCEEDGVWRILAFNLVLPIPNAMWADLTHEIRNRTADARDGRDAPGVESAPPAPRPSAPAQAESQNFSSEALAGLVGDVRQLFERDLLVGGELVVIQNRRTLLDECFGDADRDEGERWVPGTICNVRSMTKPLTGAAAQILIDRGELGLDDPVSLYLPGFDHEGAREITVRQLMTHRAGLPLTLLRSMDEHASLREMADAIGRHGPETPPDSRFWYSDAGTDALGAVVEVVSGERLDAFVTETLLEPLGMRDSFYYLDPEDPRRGRIASLYIGGPGSWQRFLDPDDGPFYPFAWGSQSLYSTPEDYAKFLAMWMDGGRVGERIVLSEAAVQRMLTPVSDMSSLGSEAPFPTLFPGLEVDYGQDAVLHVPSGAQAGARPRIIGHSGSDGTVAWAWPDRDLMVLVFTQSRGGAAVLRIEEFLDRWLIDPAAQGEEAAVPEELREYLGTYVADWANHMKEEFVVLFRGNGRLAIDVPSQLPLELAPANPEKDAEGSERRMWTVTIAPGLSVWFERDEQGTVDCLRIRQGPLTFEAPRKGSPHATAYFEAQRPDTTALAPLLGRYLDPESEGTVEVFVDGDYLAVRNAQQQLFHLWKVPIDDSWLVREAPMMTLTFQLEGGKAVSMTRHNPGGAALVMPRAD